MHKIEPKYAMPMFQLGHIKQFNLNDLDSAEILYNEALLVEPRFVEAWHNLGLIHESRGENTRALQAYAKALKYNPDFQLSREAADRLR
jgi:Tfp pilus assembly protein PilF